MDECLIVDEKDNFLAIGRCIMNRDEMLSFNYGMAVKSRENFKHFILLKDNRLIRQKTSIK